MRNGIPVAKLNVAGIAHTPSFSHLEWTFFAEVPPSVGVVISLLLVDWAVVGKVSTVAFITRALGILTGGKIFCLLGDIGSGRTCLFFP